MGFSQDRPTLKGRHVPGEKTKFKYCPATIEIRRASCRERV